MQNPRSKIKTLEEIYKIIGRYPHKNLVVLAHGMFDLIHPGHIRHLLYSKSKADILIVGVTADIHAKKTAYRPFVPQDLRALNLAALEMVDFVFIDENPTPIKCLEYLKPDIFSKGYEYQSGHVGLMAEADVVTKYGGEVLFTPGDVVYSSSAIIESTPPDISIDKLWALMKAEELTFQSLYNTLENISKQKVCVVGDTIVDTITHVNLIGGMTKTPTPSVTVDSVTDYLGGAAIVAAHLAAAGAEVEFVTVLGKDKHRDFVIDELRSHRVQVTSCVDPKRPTTNKNTFVCKDHHLLKIDTVDNRPISGETLAFFEDVLFTISADIMIFSDFRHGIFNQDTAKDLIKLINPAIPIRVADSQIASRWGNILDFPKFTMITPNEKEARFALGNQDTGVRLLATELYNKANCCYLLMKLGARGALACRGADGSPGSFFTVDSFAQKVVDPVGAGDALLAYASLSLRYGIVSATILGSVAAALECEVEGNHPIEIDAVYQRLQLLEQKVKAWAC